MTAKLCSVCGLRKTRLLRGALAVCAPCRVAEVREQIRLAREQAKRTVETECTCGHCGAPMVRRLADHKYFCSAKCAKSAKGNGEQRLWKSLGNRLHNIRFMEDSHLVNAIRHLETSSRTGTTAYLWLLQEMERRGLREKLAQARREALEAKVAEKKRMQEEFGPREITDESELMDQQDAKRRRINLKGVP